MNRKMSSAILRELQVGDLSTSTAMDNILWSRSMVLGERDSQHRDTLPLSLPSKALGVAPTSVSRSEGRGNAVGQVWCLLVASESDAFASKAPPQTDPQEASVGSPCVGAAWGCLSCATSSSLTLHARGWH